MGSTIEPAKKVNGAQARGEPGTYFAAPFSRRSAVSAPVPSSMTRSLFVAVAISLLLAATGLEAVADEAVEKIPGTGLPPTEPAPYDFTDNITGDWFGARTWLKKRGVIIRGGYAMEFMANPVGGREQGETYVHNVLLEGLFDLEKLIGVPNTTFRIAGSQRTGNSLSQEDIGNAISVQQLYGGGQRVRLVQAQFITSLFDDRLNLAYGRLAATDDFLTSPLYCQFISNGFCGQPPSPFFNLPDGISAYPTAVWGVRAKARPTAETYAQVGVYDGDVAQRNNDGNDNNKHGTNFTFGHNGVLILNEVGYTPERGLFDLPGHYKLGGYYHSGDFNEVGRDASGNSIFVSGLSGKRFTGNWGIYALFDQTVYRERTSADHKLSVFTVFVTSPDDDKNTIPYYASAGMVYKGLFPSRPEDRTAFGVYNAWFSDALSDARAEAGLERQDTETTLELNHQFQITPAVYFRPAVQYVISPNGQDDIDNAFVVGFETSIIF
jgi:porin